MRAPLSWLRDFAPFDAAPEVLAATLDDLGLVVEGVERVGEGLDRVVVARVEEIAAIEGADRIRRVIVDAGDGLVGIVCGADNFAVGDMVPLAPVGSVLPGGFEIGRRKMKGVVSDGMLCSGRELGISLDQAGLLLLTDVEGAEPGVELTELLGIEEDVVFDITVEGNRPDAWCMAGVARDLAARLGLPWSVPASLFSDPGEQSERMGHFDRGAPSDQQEPSETKEPSETRGLSETGTIPATVVVEDLDLCPRMTVSLLDRVTVGPSPRWLARRLILAGMRAVNNVVDASNYVMLELGQPTHPYDLGRLSGRGLRVRRGRPGERLVTLDGVERTVGADDCLITDAEGTPVGIGGIIGGESSEISESTTEVLLEAAYFSPGAICRTSKRLGVRTEASARFERGCDPWGIDRAVDRFCQLLGTTARDKLDVRGEVPEPFEVRVPMARVNAVLGTSIDAGTVIDLIGPIGFACVESRTKLTVTVPTDRPDVRSEPHGVADVIEEIGRTYGYSRLARRRPSWPEPGRLTRFQRERRLVADVACGIGAFEAWTPTFVSEQDHARMGLDGESVTVSNPLVAEESSLRRSMLPGLIRALAHNADRRNPEVRLFEIGTVFAAPIGDGGATALPIETELMSIALALRGDDARTAVAAWRALCVALRLAPVELVAAPAPGLHPTRSGRLVSDGRTVGHLGEVDPAVLASFGVDAGRVGWLEVELSVLLDPEVVARRPEAAVPVSRYPSSDIDLAFVVDDAVPAARVGDVLASAAGELLESIELFDVYRDPTFGERRRSLAFRLRFCAADRTLTDSEIGALRSGCIAAAIGVGAELR